MEGLDRQRSGPSAANLRRQHSLQECVRDRCPFSSAVSQGRLMRAAPSRETAWTLVIRPT